MVGAASPSGGGEGWVSRGRDRGWGRDKDRNRGWAYRRRGCRGRMGNEPAHETEDGVGLATVTAGEILSHCVIESV